MDRPRTGRRRVRSGAVRATEIIDRATRRFPRQPPPPPVEEAPTAELTAVPAEDGTPSRGRKAAKIVGLVLATLTLFAAVATAAMVSRERGSALPGGQASPITGQRALLPDHVAEAVSETATVAVPSTTAQAAPPTVSTAASTAVGAEEPKTAAASLTPHDGTEPAADGPPPAPSTAGMSDDELVAEYYRLVRSSPGSAFTLLSGTEFGADLGQFVNAWSGVIDVRVMEIATTADGVVADVRMHLATGQTLWVRQLFDVTETTPRRIANVTLLSAQIG